MLLSACGRIAFDPVAERATGDATGDTTAAACDPTKPFGMPQPMSSLVSGALDGTLRLTPDELHGVFWSTRPGVGAADIYDADRPDTTAAFTVRSEAGINTASNEYEGTLTDDGLGLVFRSDRSGNSDLYVATRSTVGAPWVLGASIGGVNTASEEIQPYLPPGRSELYYVSNLGTTRNRPFRAPRTGTLAFGSGSPVAELDDGVSNTRDAVSTADGLTIYVGSDRPGGAGGYDVWVATRLRDTDPFGPLVQVPELSTTGDEGPNYISVDGCRMYWSSTISGTVVPYLSVKPL
jgi:hypothetical protein